ncbi:MAG: glycosyltransferase family 39 protein [bacterium]
MNVLDSKIPRSYFVGLAIFALLNIFIINVFLLKFTAPFSSDSEGYAMTAQYFRGEAAPVAQRLLKPLMPFFIAISSYVFGLKASFLFLNSIFYFLIAFVIFKIVKLMFDDDKQAFIASVLFLASYPMLEYGITYMTDLASWFFCALSIYLTLVFLKEPRYKWIILNGLICLAGFLTKEYAAVGILFFFICLFFIYKGDFLQKIKYLAVYGLFFAPVFLAWQAFVYFKFHFSYFDWFSLGRAELYKEQLVQVVAKSLGATFLLGWLLVFAGVLKIKKMANENKKILLALFAPSLLPLLWIGASSRLFYVIAFLLCIFASFGMVNLGNWVHKTYAYALLLTIILAGNYFWLIYDDGLRLLINGLFKITY